MLASPRPPLISRRFLTSCRASGHEVRLLILSLLLLVVLHMVLGCSSRSLASNDRGALDFVRELGPSDDASPFKSLPPIFRDLPGANSSVPVPPFDMDATPPVSLSDASPPRTSGSDRGGFFPVLGDLSIPQV